MRLGISLKIIAINQSINPGKGSSKN